MARQIINNSPGTADSLKVGADKINEMTEELYAGWPYGYANWLGVVERKLAAGQSAVVQIWGDSTTRNGTIPSDGTPNRYPSLWAADLVTSGRLDAITGNSNCGVRIYAFNNLSGSNYQLATTVRASVGGQWLDFYLASVSGSIPRYFQHAYFFRALAAVPADALFIGHGINMASFTNIAGEMVSAIEQYRLINPACPILWTTQHPLQASTIGETSWRPAILNNASAWGVAVDDTVYQEYLIAGKPNSLYNGDGIHQSTGTGNALYVAMLNEWWDRAAPGSGVIRLSSFAVPAAQQLLTNGDFTTWTNTSAAPDGWTSSGSITFSRNTTDFATPRKTFSARMVASGSAETFIEQAIPFTVRNFMLGITPIVACARVWRDTGGTSNFLGRLAIVCTAPSIGGTVNVVVTDANIVQTNGFGWLVTRPFYVPADTTVLRIRLFVDSSTTPDATKGINVDQISCVPGLMPMPYAV